MNKLSWKVTLVASILIVMWLKVLLTRRRITHQVNRTWLNSWAVFRVVAEDYPSNGLFKFVWDDTLSGYYLLSDKVFPLKVCVLSLPDVGNYRISSHFDVVEGVRQACEIYPNSGEVKELLLPLWFTDLVVKLNVNISCVMIDNWETYKALVESDNNTIIVNTHDEYLPVPEDYGKEEWTDNIADFMLNRWGTWVHAGGYPFYRVWYQNGTVEEWGEKGFQQLMNHVGKPNVTCYPAQGIDPNQGHNPPVMTLEAGQHLSLNWWTTMDSQRGGSIADFHYSNHGYPISSKDFDAGFSIFQWTDKDAGTYYAGATVRFSPNSTSFNFGLYLHLGAWKFFGGSKEELPSDLGVGFISTAVAIFCEYFTVDRIYGKGGNSATEAIQKAEREGRINELREAKALLQNALDAYASGNYKIASAYADQAKLAAENGTAPDTTLQTVAIIATITIPLGVGAYYKINNKKNKQKRVEKDA